MTAPQRPLDVDIEPTKGAGLERILAVWSRRKWLAIPVFALPFAIAISAILSLPSLYRSTATVLVERQQVPESFVRSTVTSELETRLQTISQEVLSRARLEGLITRFGLYTDQRKQALDRRKSSSKCAATSSSTSRPSRDGKPPPSPSPSATGAAIPRPWRSSRIPWPPSTSRKT